MSSPPAQITDHTAQIQADQRSQHRPDPLTQALIAVFGDEIQLMEDFLYSVLTGRRLDNAAGVNLDRIGGIVGASRLGRSDDEFRAIIKVWIRARNSDGGAEDVTWVATHALGVTVRYIQQATAFFRLEFISDDEFSPEFMAEALKLIGLATPAGVGWTLESGDETIGARYDEGRFDESTFGTVKGGDYA